MKKNQMSRNIPIIFFALIGGAAFVYIGYITSSIIQPFEEKNYNQFTPIIMVLAFVIYEFIIFLLFVFAHKKTREKIVADSSDIEGEINVHELEEKVIEQVQQEPPTQQEREKDISIDEGIFRGLYSYHFTLEQITEMIRLSKYMRDADTDTYIKMFDISMTPEQISQYIDLFYGE